MMNLFDFSVKNREKVVELLDSVVEDKLIAVEPKDFDFTDDGITFEIEEGTLTFEVELEDEITISTSIDSSNLGESLDCIKKITDPDLRESVVLAIEEDFMNSVKEHLENVEASLSEAQAEQKNVLQEETDIKASLRDIKDEWGIV
jgi:hypothetical protein